MCRIAWSCVAAALFGLIGDLLGLAVIGLYRSKSNHAANYEDFKKLDPFLIEDDWELRSSLRGAETAARIFGSMAWVIVCVPLLHVTVELSAHGKHLIGLHTAIAVLTVMGTATEVIANVMYVGATDAMDWVANDFNLDFWDSVEDPPEDRNGNEDKIGWRTLEVVALAVHGFLLWVDALEWLFLGVILFLLFLSIQRQEDNFKILSIAFGGFGLFLSLICIVEFCTELLRFKSWRTFSQIAFGISVFARIFLWPVWYLWLGVHLARASVAHPDQQDTEMIRFPESTSNTTSTPPPPAAAAAADTNDGAASSTASSSTTTTSTGVKVSNSAGAPIVTKKEPVFT